MTCKDDGHWVTCDLFENGIGDNIALVQELEPGTGFAESVYRLSGAPSVARATRPAPAPVVRQPPKMPAQSAADVRRGRERLIHPPEVTDVAPVDGVRVVAEVVVGQLLQPGQLDVDGGSACEIGVDGSGLDVHRGAP